MAEPTTAEDTLIERVAALKHDLGKYVAWRSANLDDAAWAGPVSDELVEALRADLLATRTTADRRESAWEVWAGHRVGLPREPELDRVADSVAVLERAGPALRDGDREGIARVRNDIRKAQQAIRNELRDLHRRLLQSRER